MFEGLLQAAFESVPGERKVPVPWKVYIDSLPTDAVHRVRPVQAADPLEALSLAGFPADEHETLEMRADGSYETMIHGHKIIMAPPK